MIISRLLFIIFLVSGWCSAQEYENKADNILIVYLSRTNNTKVVAEMIHENVGGDLVALELKNPYPQNYKSIVAQVAEENRNGFLPPLKTHINMDKYDTVFLGFPTWGMQLPPPIKSFLTRHDLKDKTLIPFNTNAGYGIGSSFRTVESLCSDCNILEGFSVTGGIERDGIYLAIKGNRKVDVKELLVEWLENLKPLTVKN
ncbi:flavodoxin family protein [Arenibacter latericius]|uniref:flavodoxin family protein n=1 Tax=Arenibacter latericius TaxID=86104 RepID=UPI0004245EAC|nr:flavodoxin [Arenibacter latericius]